MARTGVEKDSVCETIELDYVVQHFWKSPLTGEAHREDGPAEIVENLASGTKVREAWKIEGEYHREGGKPAIMTWRDDGRLASEFWYEKGKPIMGPDGFSSVMIMSLNAVCVQRSQLNKAGDLVPLATDERASGVYLRRDSGIIDSIVWKNENQELSRNGDLPSSIFYNSPEAAGDDVAVSMVRYTVNDLPREEGVPSEVWFNDAGDVGHMLFTIGKRVVSLTRYGDRWKCDTAGASTKISGKTIEITTPQGDSRAFPWTVPTASSFMPHNVLPASDIEGLESIAARYKDS